MQSILTSHQRDDPAIIIILYFIAYFQITVDRYRRFSIICLLIIRANIDHPPRRGTIQF